MRPGVLFLLAMGSTLCGCAVAPSHPALSGAAMPELIPVRNFVANRQASGAYKLSPDGKKLAWMGTDGVRPAIWVKSLGQEGGKAFQVRARDFRWSGDSRYVVATVDPTGDEDNHVHVGLVEGNGTQLIDLTPFEKTAAHVVRVIEGQADLVVTMNRRDKKVFDLFRIDPRTGQHTLLAVNPGDVSWWGVDRGGRLRARLVLAGDRSLLQSQSGTDSAWKTIAQWSRWEAVRVLEFLPNSNATWALSNRGRDKMTLVRLDLDTGAETEVYAAAGVDVDQALISARTHEPLIAYSMPDYPQREVFSDDLKKRLASLEAPHPSEVYVSSTDIDERNLTVAVTTDRGTRNYLLAEGQGKPVFLGESGLSLIASGLSETRPISFAGRDGLQLHGYMTLPAGLKPERLPLVLLVHGGPWARDRWGGGSSGRSLQQFLANRGYAVLQVNYRGSSGYGRAFMEKAMGEFAGRMHDDLVDGVRWAVASGVADAAKVAIYGASYGGYSAMVGATFTPEVFACAVNVVGVTDLARLLETVPPYWELGLPWWHRYVGDPAKPEERAAMNARSPLFKAERATRPILIMHGVNDPRVKLEQSELMVTALQRAGKQVEFVTFKGDGHGNQKWTNNLAMYRKTEDFLATCLGGRSSGFDYYQLGAWAF